MRAYALAALGVFAVSVAQGMNSDSPKQRVYLVPEMCTKKVDSMKFDEEVIVKSHHSVPSTYRTNVSCALNFTMASRELGLTVGFLAVDTVDCHDYLQINSQTSESQKYCGKTYSKANSPAPLMFERGSFPIQVDWEVVPHKETELSGEGFHVVLTPFKSDCDDSENCFRCDNEHYIHKSMVCNGFNNCGDESDEHDCPAHEAHPNAISVAHGNDESPDAFKKHSYHVPEICKKIGKLNGTYIRNMKFDDQVFVETEHSDDRTYETNVSCKLNFSMAEPDLNLMVQFLVLDTVDCKDYVQIRSKETESQKYCSRMRTPPSVPLMFRNESFPVQVDWESAVNKEKRVSGQGFQVMLSPYKSDCAEDEICYLCDNGFYIHPHLVCNHFNNCGDMSDERHCPAPGPPSARSSSVGMTVVLFLCCAAVLAAVSVAVYAYRLRKERDELQVLVNERSPLYVTQEQQA